MRNIFVNRKMAKTLSTVLLFVSVTTVVTLAQRREDPTRSVQRIQITETAPKITTENPTSFGDWKLLNSNTEKIIRVDSNVLRRTIASSARQQDAATEINILKDLDNKEILVAQLEQSNPKWIGDKTSLQMTVKNTGNTTYKGRFFILSRLYLSF